MNNWLLKVCLVSQAPNPLYLAVALTNGDVRIIHKSPVVDISQESTTLRGHRSAVCSITFSENLMFTGAKVYISFFLFYSESLHFRIVT